MLNNNIFSKLIIVIVLSFFCLKTTSAQFKVEQKIEYKDLIDGQWKLGVIYKVDRTQNPTQYTVEVSKGSFLKGLFCTDLKVPGKQDYTRRQAQKCGDLSKIDESVLELFKALNTARTQPKTFAKKLAAFHETGKVYLGTEQEIQNAIEFLNTVPKKLALQFCKDLGLALAQKAKGYNQQSQKTSICSLCEYGSMDYYSELTSIAENRLPELIIMDFIIDTGNAEKQHRKNLFQLGDIASFPAKHVGIGISGNITVIGYALNFRPDELYQGICRGKCVPCN